MGTAADNTDPPRSNVRRSARVWVARILIALVFGINVMCAVGFIVQPGSYAGAYQLEGPGAQAAICGAGITFLMWNATYPPVIAHPQRYRVLFGVVLAQQAIGLVGETALLFSLNTGTTVLASSILRFIIFDAGGLVALLIAWALTRHARLQQPKTPRDSQEPRHG